MGEEKTGFQEIIRESARKKINSVEEVRELISKAIFLHLDLMIQGGEKLPEPSEKLEFIIEKVAGEEFCTWVEVRVPQLA